jgi:hypothetical protein
LLSPDHPITKEELTPDLLWKLGMQDPVVHAGMTLHRQGHITWEQALILMVKTLYDQKEEYSARLIKVHQHTAAPSYILPAEVSEEIKKKNHVVELDDMVFNPERNVKCETEETRTPRKRSTKTSQH